MFGNYIFYSICIIVLSTGSIIISVFETKANMKRLKEMAYYSCAVKVLRNGNEF